MRSSRGQETHYTLWSRSARLGPNRAETCIPFLHRECFPPRQRNPYDLERWRSVVANMKCDVLDIASSEGRSLVVAANGGGSDASILHSVDSDRVPGDGHRLRADVPDRSARRNDSARKSLPQWALGVGVWTCVRSAGRLYGWGPGSLLAATAIKPCAGSCPRAHRNSVDTLATVHIGGRYRRWDWRVDA